MSALDYLLGARKEFARVTADGLVAPRTLLREDGIRVHLQEDVYAEQVIVFSLPGTLRDVQCLDACRPWRHGLPHPRFAGVEAVLTVEPASGQVYLIDVCARTALDSTMFESFLDDHAARHRTWQRVLEEEKEEDGGVEDYGEEEEVHDDDDVDDVEDDEEEDEDDDEE
jgi:hypothetical protein